MNSNTEKTGSQPNTPPPAYDQPGHGYPQSNYGQPGLQQPSGYGQPAGYAQPIGYGQYPNIVVHQQPNIVVHTGVRPSDYLILSVVAIFFCWPMAICAIMYSCNSKTAADSGDYTRAMSDGYRARNIGIAAIIVGIVVIIVAVAVPVAIAASYWRTVCTDSYCY